jgi:orotate phosphoribosyltransferase
MSISKTLTIVKDDPFETLRLCGGYYETPERDGQLFGPLVGYAGKYDAPDGTKKQWVGKVYYNFAKAEERPAILRYFAEGVAAQLYRAGIPIHTLLGAPMGGIRLAGTLGDIMGLRVIFAEKQVTRLATETQREESKLVLGRYEIEADERVVIVEDVCNNFSTTEELTRLVENSGGCVEAVACAFNRSDKRAIPCRDGKGHMYVVSFAHRLTDQYKQEEPWVANAIQTVGLAKKPKDEWARLEEAVAHFRQ